MGEKAIITERKESRLHEPMAGFLIRIFSRIGPIDPYNMHLGGTVLGQYMADSVVRLDMGDGKWDGAVKAIRFFTFASFMVGLMILTGKVIKW